MTRKDILNHLAPCGLNCHKCLSKESGTIKEHSKILKQLLGNFDNYAERFSNFQPIFKHYPQFKEVLHILTQGDCTGCREGNCKYPHCGVLACFREKDVDFCFECENFPCDHTNFDPDLHSRWLQMNRRMKEIGVEAYYEEKKDAPRYM
ncbi:DUF3795 domain-containing protein [candidate division KSB1 bacterium]|nr:DUF3795 domain-containing protein [candidate division KSB1 bacterium]